MEFKIIVSNLNYYIRDLLSMHACTHCSLCVDACPAAAAAKDGQLSGRYRLHELKKIQKHRAGLFSRIRKKEKYPVEHLKSFSDTVFRCTLCGRCQEVCPSGIYLKDIWVSLRQDLVHSSAYPEKVTMIRDNLTETHNVFAEEDDERVDWVEDMPDAPEHGYIKDTADIVYITGCVASYFPMVQKIPMALVRLLESADVDFTLLGTEEWCCGFPLMGAGFLDKVQEIVDHNIEAVRQKGATKIVFSCPSCFQMWREYYPPEFELFHCTEFLNDLITKGKLTFTNTPLTVTYHDPCDLGRGARVYNAPRNIIRAMPGVTLIEMRNNRENCLCCGGGGNLEMIDPELASEISRRKIEEILATGVSAVVTSCQQCVRTMNTYVKKNKLSLEVLDITQLVERSIENMSK